MLNYTRIPAPRVTLVDTQTGIVTNEWFRFFNNLYTIAYSSANSVTPGTYGTVSKVPQITVDEFGTITAITEVSIAIDANQIVSGVIDTARIQGRYTGITGVGTLTAGTWNASLITSNYGGTGLNNYTAGDMFYYASGIALSKLAIGTSTYIMTSSGTAPQWTDPTTLSFGTATNIAGGLANQIPYQSAPSTTAFNAKLTFDGTNFKVTGNIFGTAGTTTMADGFNYVPAAAGAPTGVPTTVAGYVPTYYDTTNNFFYVYNGAWKKVLLV